MIKVAFFDTKKYDIESFEKVKDENVCFKYFEVRLTIDSVGLAQGFDAVCVFVNDDLNKEVVDKLYEYGVKAIFLRCAGFNNVDVKACFGKIHVYRVPAYSPYAVAEHAISLLLTSNRRIHKAYNRTREFNFSLDELTGMDLYGKTVGVIGTGKIGRIFIDICRGFKMNVIAYDPFPIPNSDIHYVELDELFKTSDIISLHCPLLDSTADIINKDSIAKMKKGVFIINTSRGGLVDSNALLEGIKQRHVGAACLDVYDEEADIFYNDKSSHILDDDILRNLISMPNVIVTSHQAFLTHEALGNIADTTKKNIDLHFSNQNNMDNEVCYHCGRQDQCAKKRNAKCF